MKYKYRWFAQFKNKTITQDPEDKYSKHDDNASWNPTSFRDFMEYFEEHPDELMVFTLAGDRNAIEIDLANGKPVVRGLNAWGDNIEEEEVLDEADEHLDDIRIIYYRKMECAVDGGVMGEPMVIGYVVGYQGRDRDGRNVKKEFTML